MNSDGGGDGGSGNGGGGNGVGGIDHLVVAVRDLDRAQDAYARLGFTLTPRGAHTELGSANHTAVFADGTYLELLAVGQPHPATAAYAAFLEAREGMAAVALKAEGAEALGARLSAAGLAPQPAVAFGRPVAARPGTAGQTAGERTSEGMSVARFTITPLPAGAMPGGGAFVCRHHTPELVWRAEDQDHANGALGIDTLVVGADDVDAVASSCARLFGTAVETQGALRSVAAGTARVLVAPPPMLAWGWTADPLLTVARPYLAGVALRVRDVYATQQALQTSKFPVIANQGMLRVGSRHAAGVMLAFARSFDLAALAA